MKSPVVISDKEKQFFLGKGYLIKRNFVEKSFIEIIQETVNSHLFNRVLPFELEFAVNYPGSPQTKTEIGGETIRRLKLAYTRNEVFRQWATKAQTIEALRMLMDASTIFLVQSHHNCIMTKQPQFSSETHWHKDIRYWNFENNHLINTWLPLGDETIENGCLQVIPGSHLWKTPSENLDDRLFLRKELPQNQVWLNKTVNVELNKGDLLFFHAALFHAAGRNTTNQSKNAVVFTYHSELNQPLACTHSIKDSGVQF